MVQCATKITVDAKSIYFIHKYLFFLLITNILIGIMAKNISDDDQCNCMELVNIDFGPKLGHLDVHQFTSQTFHKNTLQINSLTSDNTGSRIYAGSHLACRFISNYPELFEQKRVCEIGCGVGMVGICTALCTEAKSIMLTDGNKESLDIAALNVKKYNLENKITTHVLEWGEEKYFEFLKDGSESDMSSQSKSINTIKKHIYNCLPYDIVIGCELMYFKLDMEMMLTTIRALLTGHSKYFQNKSDVLGINSMSNPTPTNGLLIHSHLFRVYAHQQLFISLLKEFEWATIEIAPNVFVEENELKSNPHW